MNKHWASWITCTLQKGKRLAWFKCFQALILNVISSMKARLSFWLREEVLQCNGQKLRIFVILDDQEILFWRMSESFLLCIFLKRFPRDKVMYTSDFYFILKIKAFSSFNYCTKESKSASKRPIYQEDRKGNLLVGWLVGFTPCQPIIGYFKLGLFNEYDFPLYVFFPIIFDR